MPKKGQTYPKKRIDIPFGSFKERKRFEEFLIRTGRKAGPYVLSLIKRELERGDP